MRRFSDEGVRVQAAARRSQCWVGRAALSCEASPLERFTRCTILGQDLAFIDNVGRLGKLW